MTVSGLSKAAAVVRGLLKPKFAGSAVAGLIRRTAREQWRLLAVNLLASLLLAAAEASSFAVIFQAARVLAGSPPPALLGLGHIPRESLFLVLLAAAVALQCLASLSRYLNGVTAGYFAARCQSRITPEVHRHILGFSYAFASRYKVGDLTHCATLSPLAIQIEIEQASQIAANGLLALVYVGTLVILSPGLLLVAVALGGAIAALQGALRPMIRRSSRDLEAQRREIAGAITEDFQILRLLHSSAALAVASERLSARLAGLEQRMRRLTRLINVLEPVSDLLPVLAAVLIAALSWQLFGGRTEMLIPKLVTFVLALQRLNIRLMRMANSFNLMAENSGRVEQLDQLLRCEDKAFRRHGGRQFEGLREGIRFEAVGLRYPARSEAALCGIDLAIPCGGTVALVGASGAGKSSLADLLVGLLDPSEGRILVDGTDLRELDLDSWQRRLGVVSQDVLLVNDTIGANIAFGLAEQPPEPVLQAAAAAAGAEDFIRRLPQGYGTVIGERGYRLSGGQRQRLSLARAILRDPEVLILDEATSALDSHAEVQIHRALEVFRSGRTVLSIAHRLSSIVHADLIAVVEHGTIVEQGRHPELLARQGVYASLWRRQQKGGTQATEARP